MAKFTASSKYASIACFYEILIISESSPNVTPSMASTVGKSRQNRLVVAVLEKFEDRY